MKYTTKALQDVDGSINAAIKGMENTKRLVQVAAVAVVMHIEKCGDYRKANTLIDGLKGLNQAALVEFFVKFGGLTVSDGAKGFDGFNGVASIDVKGAKATMWYDLKVQKPWDGFDLKKGLASLIAKANQAEKRVAKDEELSKIVNINPGLLEELVKLAA